MDEEPDFARGLIVGRGLGWGLIGGTAMGPITLAVLSIEIGEFRLISFIGFAAVVGGVVGGCLGLVAGLALALSGRWAVRRIWLAQLIAAGAVAAVLLAPGYVSQPGREWVRYVFSMLDLPVVAALTAALLTPRIVAGTLGRQDRDRAQGSDGGGTPGLTW